jgi:hypothetical protein
VWLHALKIVPLCHGTSAPAPENRTTLDSCTTNLNSLRAENRPTFPENRTTLLKIVHRNRLKRQYPCGFWPIAVNRVLTKGKSFVRRRRRQASAVTRAAIAAQLRGKFMDFLEATESVLSDV